MAYNPPGFVERITNKGQAVNMLRNAIRNLHPDCVRALPSQSLLLNTANEIRWWDSRAGADGNRSMVSIVGSSYPNSVTSLSQAVQRTNGAQVLTDPRAGRATTNVVLVDFWLLSGGDQSGTVLHEALHVFFRNSVPANTSGDTWLANYLGLKMRRGENHSQAISRFLDEDCKR